jgi:hypothetical protein
MKTIVLTLVGIAALIYIGQFAYGFKERADARDAAHQAYVDKLIADRVKQVAEGR